MGKKSLFSKANSTTYSLIHGQSDGDPQRIWVQKDKGVGIGRPDAQLVEAEAHQVLSFWAHTGLCSC